jgi:hypothetical protein
VAARPSSVAIFVGSLTFYMLASVTRAYWVFWQGADRPNSTSLFSLGVVLVIGCALSADLLHAKPLVLELGEREGGGRTRCRRSEPRHLDARHRQ